MRHLSSYGGAHPRWGDCDDDDDDDDDDYTFPIQGSGVCIDQRQYAVSPLCPVLGVLPPWEENPSQTQTVR